MKLTQYLQQQMNAGSNSHNNKCFDCGLHFDSPNELLNHKRKFCINSGYDNLQGLARIQFNGVNPTYQQKTTHKNNLQQYGANSLTKIGEYDELSASNLERDMKNINRFKRQLDHVGKYKHKTEIEESQLSGSKYSKMGNTRLTNNPFSESKLDEELKRFQKIPKEEAISPPTFIDQLNMRNHTVLDKSNSSLEKMAKKDRVEYARVKLDQLNDIKDMYVKNGGNKKQFKINVDKMIEFYNKFLSENIKESKTSQEDSLNFIESRVSTPILKLRDFKQSNIRDSRQSQKGNRSNIKQQQINKKSYAKDNNIPSNINQNTNGYGYHQPQIIMMPYSPPTQPQSSMSNDGLKLLQRMVELKSQQNQKLLDILLQQKKRNNQPQQPSYYPYQMSNMQPTSLPLNSSPNIFPPTTQLIPKPPSNKPQINVQSDYQFKKSMIQDLISEQKVLLALQQQQLDELKLLSQLPKQLQQIKLKSAIKSSDIRFQMEKQILKQKMERLAFQESTQTFQEERKLTNDRWAGEERKKLLENQMQNHVNNFQFQFGSPNQLV